MTQPADQPGEIAFAWSARRQRLRRAARRYADSAVPPMPPSPDGPEVTAAEINFNEKVLRDALNAIRKEDWNGT